jgi:ribosome-associated toxin RatA of RatAB toxin-antitoxin module
MNAVRLVLMGVVLMAAAGPVRAEPPGLPCEYDKSPDGKPLTDEQRTALDKGEILVHLAAIKDTPVKKATAIALVDAPPEQVFAVLTDYNEFTRFMPYCKKVKLQKRKDEKSWVRFELDFPWPIGDRHYVLQMTDRREEVAGTPVLVSRWTYEPDSGNINDSKGSWELIAYGPKRSFVRYTVFTDPGGSVPNWAGNMATEVAVPKVIQGLRERAKTKAAGKPKPSAKPEG